eukprot:UC1_evm1s843
MSWGRVRSAVSLSAMLGGGGSSTRAAAAAAAPNGKGGVDAASAVPIKPVDHLFMGWRTAHFDAGGKEGRGGGGGGGVGGGSGSVGLARGGINFTTSATTNTGQDGSVQQKRFAVEAARRRIADAEKPPRVLFLERATQCLIDHLPMLWRLGHTFKPVEPTEGDRPRSILFDSFDMAAHLGASADGSTGAGEEARAAETAALCHAVVQRYASLVSEHFLRRVD